MANPVQASFGRVYDAGQVRLAQLGQDLLRREQELLPTEPVEKRLIDLRRGLEVLARLSDPAKIATVSAYLVYTYGLLEVYTDPLLRPDLPAIPVDGAQVRRFVLGHKGRVIGNNGRLIGTRSVLEPLTPVQIPGE